MGFITAAVIAASVAAASVAAAKQAKASGKNADNNLQAQIDSNAANYRMFQESRGSQGNAILPMYLPTGTEKRLGRDATQLYNLLTDQQPVDALGEYQAVADGFNETANSSDQLVKDLFSGENLKRRTGNLNPVLAAVRTGGEAGAVGLLDAAATQQQQEDLAARAAGYSSSGSTASNRRFGAVAGGTQGAARMRAAAELEAAKALYGLQESDLQQRYASLDLPERQAAARIKLMQLPSEALVARQRNAMEPFNFFRIGVGNPPTNRPAIREDTADPSAVMWSGIGQGLGALGGYGSNLELARSLRPAMPARNQWSQEDINSFYDMMDGYA